MIRCGVWRCGCCVCLPGVVIGDDPGLRRPPLVPPAPLYIPPLLLGLYVYVAVEDNEEVEEVAVDRRLRMSWTDSREIPSTLPFHGSAWDGCVRPPCPCQPPRGTPPLLCGRGRDLCPALRPIPRRPIPLSDLDGAVPPLGAGANPEPSSSDSRSESSSSESSTVLLTLPLTLRPNATAANATDLLLLLLLLPPLLRRIRRRCSRRSFFACHASTSAVRASSLSCTFAWFACRRCSATMALSAET